ncbi:MAG: hypothetical protein COA57_10220 [Flavobacteriales bacterium]|nr:MAG: hypothetical protein COA57_10220 [Flavobacteriales bacterium]
MFAIFTKKKLSEDKVANIFVNGLLQLVDEGFPQVAEIINTDPEFAVAPSVDENDSYKFLLVVAAGNLKYIPNYFESYQDTRLIDKIYSKLALALGAKKDSLKQTISQYQALMARLNHPSKNTHYAMSKAIFDKYNLYDYQQEYFCKMKTPNPIFLKRLDDVVANFIWDWPTFIEKYRITE